MRLLDKVENWLEEKIDGFFGRRFQEEIQPIEIGKRLLREMEQQKTISVAKTYIPDQYTVSLSSQDYAKMHSLFPRLSEEMAQYLAAEADKAGYLILTAIQIFWVKEEKLHLGQLEVKSAFSQNLPAKIRQIELMVIAGNDKGRIFSVRTEEVQIGRREDNEICLHDLNISRLHAKIKFTADGLVIQDSNSTNGLKVNGKKVKDHILQNKDIIELGTTALLVKVV